MNTNQTIKDLANAINTEGSEPNLTWIELADALGVEKNAEGNLPGNKLANACLHVQFNPKVMALPEKERLRVIRSAAGALGALRSGGPN